MNHIKNKIVNFMDYKSNTMEGINFVTDENNKKIAVQIDLEKYGTIWEDIYDGLLAESRKDEESIPLNEVLSQLQKEGKIDENL